ncbi:MAG: polysaccharide export outer membrane protein [Planctomycetota bacterium]|jgi:polysaccharide export outer membrane protein
MTMQITQSRLLIVLGAALAALAGCAGIASPDGVPVRDAILELPRVAPPAPPLTDSSLLDYEALRTSRPAPSTTEYQLGPGDELAVFVAGHPGLSGRFVLGPDGRLGFPLIGSVSLSASTRNEAARELATQLAPYLATPPSVVVDVTRYLNNKVYVFGRVEQPGIIELTGSGTLLQAISAAGGLPLREFRALLSRAAIVRGRDEILWIDLTDLLQNGNLALNVPLRNGDVIYIPDSEDSSVFVMGEVATPGAVQIKARLRLTQALARAGGPTKDADLKRIYLLRPNPGGEAIHPMVMDLSALLETGDFSEDIELLRGDILYIARSGMGNVGYTLSKLSLGFPIVFASAAVGGD